MENTYSFLEQFAQQVLDDAGLVAIPEEDRKAALHQMTSQMQERIGAALIQTMTDESAAAYAQLLDQDADEAAHHAFWKEHLPEYDAIVKQQLQEFQQEFVQTLGRVAA